MSEMRELSLQEIVERLPRGTDGRRIIYHRAYREHLALVKRIAELEQQLAKAQIERDAAIKRAEEADRDTERQTTALESEIGGPENDRRMLTEERDQALKEEAAEHQALERAVRERDRLAAENEAVRKALAELIEVGDLRGETTLLHPADDALPWTARMQQAWDDARDLIDAAPPAAPKDEPCDLRRQGGSWLAAARSWIQQRCHNGSAVAWGSRTELRPPLTVADVEEIAAKAVEADRAERDPSHTDPPEAIDEVIERCPSEAERESKWLTAVRCARLGNRVTLDGIVLMREEAAPAEEHPATKVVDALDAEIERELGLRRTANKGGQQVPNFGDFVGCTVSSLRRLRWWMREVRAALKPGETK